MLAHLQAIKEKTEKEGKEKRQGRKKRCEKEEMERNLKGWQLLAKKVSCSLCMQMEVMFRFRIHNHPVCLYGSSCMAGRQVVI